MQRGDSLHKSVEVENPIKNDEEELQDDELQGIPECLQDFKEGLVDESVPPHQYSSNSSHDLTLEPRAKVVPGPG